MQTLSNTQTIFSLISNLFPIESQNLEIDPNIDNELPFHMRLMNPNLSRVPINLILELTDSGSRIRMAQPENDSDWESTYCPNPYISTPAFNIYKNF